MIVVVGDVEIPWSWTNDDHSRIFELYRIYVIIAMIEKLNYCEHFYNVFGMTRSLNPVPPVLEASIIPLGYRGGGKN